MLGFKKQKNKKDGLAVYFTEKELGNPRIKNILLNLVESKVFIGQGHVIIGEAEYEIIKRSGSAITEYKEYKKRGVKKIQIDGAKEIGKYKGRRLLLKKNEN